MDERRIRVYNSRHRQGVPCITFEGKWLSEAGFHPGDYLSVSAKDENITIKIRERFIEGNEK